MNGMTTTGWTLADIEDELAYIAEAERCGCGSCLSFAEGWKENLAVVLAEYEGSK